ncbi:CDP-6-deoxy-delta-3,4-glucoseen reductase [Massilia sp. W12]|uniref:CDP-6-deoxy-delta-3,4-glucoseen reductase n=1 Tax=Massilia sp. W12 TaxID=3126507 RepID=UPI0030CB37CF
MTFQITVMPSGRQFTCDEGETVLEAAMRAGVGLPYGCKNGACASCKCKRIDGEVRHQPHQEKALSEGEESRGWMLSCCAVPHSDLTLEAREVLGVGDHPLRKMPTRVKSISKAAPDVIVLKLQLPANERLQYHAGQFLEFMLTNGERRSYSMANAPHTADELELHIRHMPGGLFTDHVFNKMKEREILRFEAPLGTFFLREDSDKPMILLASGTGFAPLKAIIEHAKFLGCQRPMHLYWGGRRPQDLYMDALCRSWLEDIPHFQYTPVVSDALPEDGWQGRSGFVHQAVLADYADLSGHQVYACGAPLMVAAAQRDFCARAALPAEEFYADAFTSKADQ